MNIIITLLIIILISYLSIYISKKIKIPGVVILILIGLIFNISFLKDIFIRGNENLLFMLGNIGLIFLMFLAGLETSWRQLYNEKRDSTFIALFAAIIPFTLGVIVFKIIGFPLSTAIMIGIGMSITAEATKARVLLNLKKLRTRVGASIMGAGIIDDIIGLSLFIILSLSIGLWSKENLLVIGVIIAFFTGVLIQTRIQRKNKILRFSEKILLVSIIPFFFISMGMHFEFKSLVLNPFILITIISIAIIGKILGVYLTKPFTKFNSKQLFLIGWAMNSRGAVELALALIAFKTKIISIEIYSSLIIMALITTIIFPL